MLLRYYTIRQFHKFDGGRNALGNAGRRINDRDDDVAARSVTSTIKRSWRGMNDSQKNCKMQQTNSRSQPPRKIDCACLTMNLEVGYDCNDSFIIRHQTEESYRMNRLCLLLICSLLFECLGMRVWNDPTSE